MSSTNDNFPIQLWNQKIKQKTENLNMLHPLQCNPHLLAYAVLNDIFNFN